MLSIVPIFQIDAGDVDHIALRILQLANATSAPLALIQPIFRFGGVGAPTSRRGSVSPFPRCANETIVSYHCRNQSYVKIVVSLRIAMRLIMSTLHDKCSGKINFKTVITATVAATCDVTTLLGISLHKDALKPKFAKRPVAVSNAVSITCENRLMAKRLSLPV